MLNNQYGAATATIQEYINRMNAWKYTWSPSMNWKKREETSWLPPSVTRRTQIRLELLAPT